MRNDKFNCAYASLGDPELSLADSDGPTSLRDVPNSHQKLWTAWTAGILSGPARDRTALRFLEYIKTLLREHKKALHISGGCSVDSCLDLPFSS